MRYVMIENPGVAPSESFTILGASTKSSGDVDTIGRFGSGNKHSICLLLRHGISPIVFSSNLRMTFSAKRKTINDGISENEFGQINVQYSGKDENGRSRSSNEELSFVMEYGNQNWADVDLAMREFVSNAIDHAVKFNRHSRLVTQTPWEGVKVEIVDENRVRAKGGHTRVFVPLTYETQRFVDNLAKWFLHFEDPALVKATILPKNNRNLNPDDKCAVIYRRGVRVRECESRCESVFDYNLEDLQLDESRLASDYDVRYYAGLALRDANVDQVSEYLSGIGTRDVWEDGLLYDANNGLYGDTKVRVQSVWTEAFENVYSKNCLVTYDKVYADSCRALGYSVIEISNQKNFGIEVLCKDKTAEAVLSSDQLDKKEIVDPTEPLLNAVRTVWNRLDSVGMTRGKDFPEVKEFKSLTDVGVLFGYCRGNAVYFNSDFVGSADTTDLRNTIVEELSHYISGHGDYSREFQNFLIKAIVALM